MRIDIVKLIILCLFWFGLSGIPNNYSDFAQFIISMFASYFLAYLLKVSAATNQINWRSYKYCCWLALEIFKSSISVIKIIIAPKINVSPGFFWLNSIQKSDIGQLIYANSITLTPGTVTVSTDNNQLLVHFLVNSSMHELQSGEMDNKVAEIIKKSKL